MNTLAKIAMAAAAVVAPRRDRLQHHSEKQRRRGSGREPDADCEPHAGPRHCHPARFRPERTGPASSPTLCRLAGPRTQARAARSRSSRTPRTRPRGWPWISMGQIGTVYADPCHWQSTPVSEIAYPTVDTLVAALVTQQRDATAHPGRRHDRRLPREGDRPSVPLSIEVTPGTKPIRRATEASTRLEWVRTAATGTTRVPTSMTSSTSWMSTARTS